MTNETLLALIRNYGDVCGSAAIWSAKDGYTFPGAVTAAQEYRDKSRKLLEEITAELKAREPHCGIQYHGEGAACTKPLNHYGRHSWASTEVSSPFEG